MGKKGRKPATAPAEEPGASAGVELPERWSVQRKIELVLRLLRGEALDAVSRESQIPAHELERAGSACFWTPAPGVSRRAPSRRSAS
jgi:hypothetical protein